MWRCHNFMFKVIQQESGLVEVDCEDLHTVEELNHFRDSKNQVCGKCDQKFQDGEILQFYEQEGIESKICHIVCITEYDKEIMKEREKQNE